MLENPIKVEIQPALMTISETASYLNVSTKSVYRLIEQKGLPTYRLLTSIRTKKEDIDRWLAEQKAE